MATVHPFKGYLNTEFHIFAKGSEDVSYKVYSKGSEATTPLTIGVITPNIPCSLKLNEHGTFQIEFSDGSSSEIIVEDGYKFGGSEYKKSFIFDETPWCFIIMNDRTYFYNRVTEESYLEAISPDNIIPISRDYVIIENNYHAERTLYSLEQQCPILNISNIIYHNEDLVIWKECQKENDSKIIIYSLNELRIIKEISTTDHIIDEDGHSLVYSINNSLNKLDLSLPLKEEQTLRIFGEIKTLIAPNIAVSIEESYGRVFIILFDTRQNKLVCRLNVNGIITYINSKIITDVRSHVDKINNFNFELIDCKGVKLTATYLSYQFFPTKWDVLYIVRETNYEKGQQRSKNTYKYLIKSLTSNEEYTFVNDIKDVVVHDYSICFSNYNENLILGKNIKSEYSNNTSTYIHNDNVILESNGCISKLDDMKGWCPLEVSNYSLRYFDDFGIVENKTNNTFMDLYGHTFHCPIYELKKPYTHLVSPNKIILSNGKILPSLKSSTSQSQKYTLNIGKDGITLSFSEHEIQNRKEILSELYDTSSYKSVLLSEDGSQIIYRDQSQAIVMDLQSCSTESFDNVSYIKDINGVRPLFSHRPGSLQPRLINPVTGQVIPCERMSEFQFISPNGLLYADTKINDYIETWDLISGRLLSDGEIINYVRKFNYAFDLNTETDRINKRNRQNFILKNLSFFKKNYEEKVGGDRSDKELIYSLLRLSYHDFEKLFIERRGIAYIRSKDNDAVVAKINLGPHLKYLNYVSFSYDNRFVAIAGRYPNSSNFGGLFLVYDLISKKEIIAQRNTWAVWTTSFNIQNHVAAYSGEPITYDATLSNNDAAVMVNLLTNYNFLTFSPNGEFAALSNQGYVSKYDKHGNERKEWGHKPSCEVFIVKTTDMKTILRKYSDLSDSGIDGVSDRTHNFPKTVASVSFSNDNKRLMMVGKDGVVIIRNLHLDDYAE